MFRTLPIVKPIEYINALQKIIDKQNIHRFCVKINPDELRSLPSSSQPLKEDEVYIIINAALRKIFLWVGTAAPVRSKFVGAHSANVIQRETGIIYRVENVDQEHLSSDFLRTLSVFEA
jgi:hypothetical protein